MIRPATVDDADAIGPVQVQGWREAYPGLVPDSVLVALDSAQRSAQWRARTNWAGVFVAEHAGAVVGFGASGTNRTPGLLPAAGEVLALYVQRRAQRLGLGRGLMAAMAQHLLAGGHRSAGLWVLTGNAPACAFYAALGGRAATERQDSERGYVVQEIGFVWDDVTQLIPNASASS